MSDYTITAKAALGTAIAAVSGFLGGMDGVMYALIACISIDYVTGVASAAKQKKLSSETGFWGLVRKVCILALVGVANMIDINVIGNGDVFRTAVATYYIGNEGISLLENIGSLGVQLPPKLIEVLIQIRGKGDNDEHSEENRDH